MITALGWGDGGPPHLLRVLPDHLPDEINVSFRFRERTSRLPKLNRTAGIDLLRIASAEDWEMRKLLLAGACAALLAGSGHATVLTFDDLASTYTSPIPNGYGGFNWNNFDYKDITQPTTPPSGYHPGTVSPNNSAFNASGNPATMTASSSNPFNFMGAYLTAAWNDGLNVRVQGYLNSVLEYDTTVDLSATAPTLFTFNYENVSELLFSSFGGTPDPAYSASGSGTQFVMDNFTFTPVPEPGTGLLVMAGLLGLAMTRHKRT